jgi:hypothetical protein
LYVELGMDRPLFILLSLVLCVAPVWADAPANPKFPGPYSARYTGVMGLLDTRVNLARTAAGLRYEYRSSLAGYTFYECSLMALNDGQLAPIEFIHKEIGGDGKRDEHILFDAAKRTVTVTHGGETRVYPDLNFPIWDALSVQLKVAADIAGGLKALSYQVADKGGIKTRNFRVGQPGRVSFKGRDYAGVRIERDETKQRFYILVAPKLNYVPVELGYNAKVVGWVTAGLAEYQTGSAATVPARCEPK